jgi:hypothetical protein
MTLFELIFLKRVALSTLRVQNPEIHIFCRPLLHPCCHFVLPVLGHNNLLASARFGGLRREAQKNIFSVEMAVMYIRFTPKTNFHFASHSIYMLSEA